MDAAEQKGTSLLPRQGIYHLFEAAKLVAGIECAVDGRASAQPVQVGHIVERDNCAASRLVGKMIAGYLVQERQSVPDLAPVFRGECPYQSFGCHIV